MPSYWHGIRVDMVVALKNSQGSHARNEQQSCGFQKDAGCHFLAMVQCRGSSFSRILGAFVYGPRWEGPPLHKVQV